MSSLRVTTKEPVFSSSTSSSSSSSNTSSINNSNNISISGSGGSNNNDDGSAELRSLRKILKATEQELQREQTEVMRLAEVESVYLRSMEETRNLIEQNRNFKDQIQHLKQQQQQLQQQQHSISTPTTSADAKTIWELNDKVAVLTVELANAREEVTALQRHAASTLDISQRIENNRRGFSEQPTGVLTSWETS